MPVLHSKMPSGASRKINLCLFSERGKPIRNIDHRVWIIYNVQNLIKIPVSLSFLSQMYVLDTHRQHEQWVLYKF